MSGKLIDNNRKRRGRPKTIEYDTTLEIAVNAYWSKGIDGMSVNEVIPRCTQFSAQTMGLSNIDNLRVGSNGDLTVLRLEDGQFTLRDRLSTATSIGPNTWEPGMTVTATSRLTHVVTVKDGEIYKPWLP